MRERTVIVNSMSKTYSVTGWRVGYCIAPPEITGGIRKVHDFLTVGAAAPLQAAGAYALSLPSGLLRYVAEGISGTSRSAVAGAWNKSGFKTFVPDGAYYIMTDISDFGLSNDVEFTRHLIREIGVACVPGSSFYSVPERGAQQVRFCFCKKDETLESRGRAIVEPSGAALDGRISRRFPPINTERPDNYHLLICVYPR